MKKVLRVLLLAASTILLIILIAFPCGKIISFIGMGSSGFWIGSNGQLDYIVGLFMAYAFSIPFVISVFGKNKKYWLMLILVVLELLFFYNDLRWIIIVVITALIGWLLGEGILRIYKSVKK